MLKRLRTFLSTTEGKLKAVILVSGAGIVLLVLMVAMLQVTSTPKFCSLCHEMSPEYYTWEASAHNKIPCVDCHVKPGIKNFVVHKIDSLKQVYYHFTGTYPQPITLNEDIANVQCEQCHDMDNRVTSAPGDIKFPHAIHLNQSLNCVDCHSGVAHGNIEERGFTTLTNYNKWNALIGKAYMQAGFDQVSMNTCINCHQEQNAPVTCETCHTKIVKPQNHISLNWLTEHGKQAEQDIQVCNKCHANTSTLGDNGHTALTVADYARANTFCSSCHAKEPAGHTSPTWKKDHAAIAKQDSASCFVCHDQTGDTKADKAPSTVLCASCHSEQHWLQKAQSHPVTIPPSGLQLFCGKCHVLSICEQCHAVPTQ